MRYNQTFPALESFDPELCNEVAQHSPEPADTPPFAEDAAGLEVTDLADPAVIHQLKASNE